MGISVDLIKKLKDSGISAVESPFAQCGYHVEVQPEKDQVRAFASIMFENLYYLDFVSAVHVSSGIQVVYQFGHFDEGCHVNAKAFTSDGNIPTISDIFHGANWHERETKDFYGLNFEGHKDLRVLILAEDDEDLKPLLKSEGKLKDLDGIARGSEVKPKKEKLKKEKKAVEQDEQLENKEKNFVKENNEVVAEDKQAGVEEKKDVNDIKQPKEEKTETVTENLQQPAEEEAAIDEKEQSVEGENQIEEEVKASEKLGTDSVIVEKETEDEGSIAEKDSQEE